MVSAVRVGADPAGKTWRIGVIGKRTWIVERGRCVLAPEQVPLVMEPLYDEARGVLLHDADIVLNRRRADIIVDGNVYPPDGRTPFPFGLQVGATRRLAQAHGARRVARTHTGGLVFSAPGPAASIPLGWESAYGGVDVAARADIGDPFEEMQAEMGVPPDPRFGLFAYPRNPVGRGYLIEPTQQAIDGCELPLIEDAEAPLTPASLVRGDFVRWPEGPVVAGFGWLSYNYFPRSAMLGAAPLVYDGDNIPPSRFFEVHAGDLPAACVRPERPFSERLAVEFTQGAALGMRAAEIEPGDLVTLDGMHRREPRWRFAVPAERPRMGIRFAGEKATPLPAPRIRTMLIEPDHDRLTLVWTAEMELAAPPGPKRSAGLEHAVVWSA